MNLSKALAFGRQLCRNLHLKEFDTAPETARAVLEEVWQDVHSSCHTRRDPAWLEAGPDLSVILAVYNDDAHICRSVESVLNQRSQYSLELVVVNDGSTDDTAAMLYKYESLPNVTVIHQENTGLSGARNAGLSVCRGKYILFHDSDDTLLPGAVENLLTCAHAEQADLVAGGYLEESPQGVRTPGVRYTAPVLPNRAISGMACGKVYRRELFANLQFPLGYWYEDSVVSQILLPAAKNCRCVEPEVFACFCNAAGISGSSRGKPKSLDSLYITEQLLKDKALFGLPLDSEAYEHFLYMVELTYQRTRLLEPRVIHAVFQHQRYLKNTFFPGQTKGSALEKALCAGNYKRYLWNCEMGWLLRRFRR